MKRTLMAKVIVKWTVKSSEMDSERKEEMEMVSVVIVGDERV